MSVRGKSWVGPEFSRFLAAGAAGFLTDAVLLFALSQSAGVDPLLARIGSFSTALCVTWLLNRRWTFVSQASGMVGIAREVVSYAAVQLTGGAVNIAVYAAGVELMGDRPSALLVALCAGSAAALFVNYAGARTLVFSGSEAGRRFSGWLQRFLILLAATVMLLAPLKLAGGPFVNADSRDYYTIGKSISNGVLALIRPEAGGGAVLSDQGGKGGAGEIAPEKAEPAGEWMSSFGAARSGAYSLLLYLSAAAGTLWATAFIQAFLCAWLIALATAEAGAGFRSARYFATIAACALLTGLPFYAGWPMPDIYAGLFVLACVLFVFGRRTDFTERAGLWCVMSASAAMHSTIFGLALLAIPFGWAGMRIAGHSRSAQLSVTALIVLAIVPASVFSSVYGLAAKRASGVELHSPPFLTARLIGDGTAGRLLGATCTEAPAPYALCRFRSNAYADHNAFLWDIPGQSYFYLDPETQEALREEQIRFAVAVVTTFPADQAAAALKNAAHQFIRFGVDHDAVSIGDLLMRWPGAEIAEAAPPDMRRCLAEGTCSSAPDMLVWDLLIRLGFLAALLAAGGYLSLAWRVRRSIGLDEGDRRVAAGLIMLAAFLVANAAMCGMLSGVHDRYQGRISWTFPALLLACLPQIRSLHERLRISRR